jgi:hypothetical protein
MSGILKKALLGILNLINSAYNIQPPLPGKVAGVFLVPLCMLHVAFCICGNLFHIILADSKSLICMKRYFIGTFISLAFSVICYGQKSPHINIFPPQMHQQICQQSTFTRYLEVYNTGDTILNYQAVISPDTISWVNVAPLSGQIHPGDTVEVEFDFNSAGLPLNNYYADLNFTSNDPENPEVGVLTMLHVQILTIVINPEHDSICLGCSTQLVTHAFGCSEAYSFSWVSDPPGFSSYEKSPVVSPQVTTTYTVKVADGNYSDQKSVAIKVAPSSGVKENQFISNFSIFPNPCDEACTMKFSSEYHGSGLINITDLTGSIIQATQVMIIKGMNEFLIQTSDINPGAYLLSLQADNRSKGLLLLSSPIFVR